MLESIRGLTTRGHSVHVVVPGPGPMTERARSLAASLHRIFCPWWFDETSRSRRRLNFFGHQVLAVFRLVFLMLRLRPDVVVTNTIAIPAAAVAAALARRPHVWYVHEFGDLDHGFHFQLGRAASLRLMRWLSRVVIVNSPAVRRHFAEAFPADQMYLVRYAIESDAITKQLGKEASPKTTPLLVLSGRKSPGKGQDDAIRAVGKLARDGVRVDLMMIGWDAGSGPELRRLADDLGVASQIRDIPFVDDPFGLVADADIVLVCSRNEAFGRVTVEAMKLGKAIVASRSGASPDLLDDGVTALLYAPGDADELAARIAELLSDPRKRAALGQKARAVAEATYSMDNHLGELTAAFDAAVQRR